jgi:hypothetical protein
MEINRIGQDLSYALSSLFLLFSLCGVGCEPADDSQADTEADTGSETDPCTAANPDWALRSAAIEELHTAAAAWTAACGEALDVSGWGEAELLGIGCVSGECAAASGCMLLLKLQDCEFENNAVISEECLGSMSCAPVSGLTG